LSKPASGWGLVRSLMCVTKNTKVPDLASVYTDTALSVPVQTAMAGAPYYIAPTNATVPFGSEMAKIAPNARAMDAFVQTDWAKINPRRAEYIDRFNRLVKR
jgi:putative spermidine/putrescine transport system substrate-binding protein